MLIERNKQWCSYLVRFLHAGAQKEKQKDHREPSHASCCWKQNSPFLLNLVKSSLKFSRTSFFPGLQWVLNQVLSTQALDQVE